MATSTSIRHVSSNQGLQEDMYVPIVSFSSSGISLNPKCVVRALLLDAASGVTGLGLDDDDEACFAVTTDGPGLACVRLLAVLLNSLRPDMVVCMRINRSYYREC